MDSFPQRANPKDFISRYEILHKDFKQERKLQSYYLISELIRCFIFSILIVVFYQYPFHLMILILISNSILVVYLILIRPFKSRKEFVVTVLNEIIFSLASCACLYMSVLDKTEDEDHENRFKAGWVVFYANMFLIFVLIIDILFDAFYEYKKMFSKKKKNEAEND